MSRELFYICAVWFVLISLVTAAVTVADKVKAKKGSFRVPEKVLILLALLGGSFAEYMTMRAVRHKTLHKKFMIGLPFIMIAQIVTVSFLIVRFFS